MQYPVPDAGRSRPVWRYLSLGRFTWLLQKKMLWLSRADRLNDRWETLPSAADIERLMASGVPEIGTAASPYTTEKGALLGLVSVMRGLMQHAFVNCWFDSPSESFDMWWTYGRTSESVAIQTTLGKLSDSVPRDNFEVLPVRYDHHFDSRVVEPLYLVTRKRAEFAYENEIRIVHLKDPRVSPVDSGTVGVPLAWDPAAFVEQVCVHPDADQVMFETVVDIVRQYAPSLAAVVRRSDLSQGPEAVFTPAMMRAMKQGGPAPRATRIG